MVRAIGAYVFPNRRFSNAKKKVNYFFGFVRTIVYSNFDNGLVGK